MIEYGVMQWQGTLRKTFEKYLHPDVIDKSSPELFETLGSGRVPDLFQFSTALGQASIKKIKPSTLIEATAISSIIRLMTEGGGEQPTETFIRFKNDISQWYQEMDSYGLNEDEVKMFEKHLEHLNGVADSQESIMLMSMDKGIANFDLKMATKLRKLISKKKKEEAMAFKEVIYDHVEKAGNRKQVADYFWLQVSRMLLYSFSVPHSLAYTLVGFEELNLFHHYNPIYWQTACLTVNSGSQELEEGDKKKDKNYGKVAEAIGKMKNYGVNIALPDINHAGISFTPDAEHNRIVYSLKGIAGMNDETSRIIIDHRPYKSFQDFHERLYANALVGYDEDGQEIRGKLLQKKHVLNLIKAGAFNEFADPVEIMKEFVFYEVDKKTTLNMQNIKSVIRLGLLESPEYSKYLEVMQLRDDLRKKKVDKVTMERLIIDYKLTKADKCCIVTPKLYEQYQKFFPENGALLEYAAGGIIISEKRFDKEYQKFIEPLKEIIATPEFVKEFNIAQFYEIWDNVAQGTVQKWEMDSVTYYSDKHELDGVDMKKYDIANYFEIDPTPEVIETYTRGNREYQKNKIYTLIGTVLDRNKDKHQFSLLTPDGVVTCKTYSGAFSHYDKAITRKGAGGKKETIEKSWFTRGNLIMVKGFRRDDQFVLRTNATKGQEKEHTIKLIWGVEENGELLLQNERAKV